MKYWAYYPLLLLAFLLPPSLNAATVKPYHPRIYLDQARIDTIKNTPASYRPLEYSNFPANTGTLRFELYPTQKPDNITNNYSPLLDQYDAARNHFFIRHVDNASNAPSEQHIQYQLAFQSADQALYIAGSGFWLTTEQWHDIRISWDLPNRLIQLEVDGDVKNLPWLVNTNFSLNQQLFNFSGRGDALNNIRLYDHYDYQQGNVLANFLVDENQGIKLQDSTNQHQAILSGYTQWLQKSVNDPAIQLNYGSLLRPHRDDINVLYEAREATLGAAKAYAQQILSETHDQMFLNIISTGHPNQIKRYARTTSLAWLLTGDNQYRDAAFRYANLILSVDPVTGGEYPRGGRVEALGFIYDWLYASLPSAKNITVNNTNVSRDTLYQYVVDSLQLQDPFLCGYSNTITENWSCVDANNNPIAPYTSYIATHSQSNNRAAAIAVLAMIDEYPDLQPLQDLLEHHQVEGFNKVRAWIAIDGGYPLGWAYSSGYTYIGNSDLWTKATDLNLVQDWQRQLVNRYIYGLRGNYTFPAGGDDWNDGAGSSTLAGLALWQSNQFNDSHAQWFYNNVIEPSPHISRFSELLYWQPERPSSPVNELPTSHFARNVGQVIARNHWDYPNATLLEFKSSSYWDAFHHHRDQNRFSLYYKAPLLLDSGYYDTYATNHWYHYYSRTIAHNSITVWDPDENFLGRINDGGQRSVGWHYPYTLENISPGGLNALDGVSHYEYNDDYTYVSGNASKAYVSTKLDQDKGFIRDLLFLKNPSWWDHPVVLTFDHVKTTTDKAHLNKRYLLHTAQEPIELDGIAQGPGIHTLSAGTDTLVITNQAGKLFAQTVLPKDANISKIGGIDNTAGRDYRFLVPQQDDANGYVLSGDQVGDPHSTRLSKPNVHDEDMGTWRIEVMPNQAQQEEFFLHVLSVADNTAEAPSTPPDTQDVSTTSSGSVLLARQQLLVFAKQAASTNLSWQQNSVAPQDMLIMGVKPSSKFQLQLSEDGHTVELSTATTGELHSSTQGVIHFQPENTDNDNLINLLDSDDDNDGMPDSWEENYGLNPLDASDATQDKDKDGNTNLEEYQQGGNPTDPLDGKTLPPEYLAKVMPVALYLFFRQGKDFNYAPQ